MHLGLRVLAGIFLIVGLAAYFVMRILSQEVKPAMRDVMEEVMVDSAYLLAEIASGELAARTINSGEFAKQLKAYEQRKISASISKMEKETLDFHVSITDVAGVVVFDSTGKNLGADFSKWRDVALALKGEYGARATREVQLDDASIIFYVAAPVRQGERVIGALTVSKPISTVQPFIERTESSIRRSGRQLIALSLTIGIAATFWLAFAVRRLVRYADEVEAGKRVPLPNVPGELGKLAQGMNRMRERLEGQKTVENTVRALTHELKSPLAAIRGAGELLREPMPDADRLRFAANVCEQSDRLNELVSRMLELSKLEQTQALAQRSVLNVETLLSSVRALHAARADERGISIECTIAPGTVQGDEELLSLALSNLVSNAIDFSARNTKICISSHRAENEIHLTVRDFGAGFSDFAIARAGERFFSTARPDGGGKGSGLGLAITQQIAQLHGGSLRLTNANPGAQAEIVLPLHTRFT
jgi:two-component system, OmpR family, sensor histidine kinase CreC